MPLIKGKSSAAFTHNIKAEIKAGKPQNQALAIAYATKRKAQKMASGGSIYPAHLREEQSVNYIPYSNEQYDRESREINKEPNVGAEFPAIEEDAEGGKVGSLADAMRSRMRMKKMARGGFVDEKETGYLAMPEEREEHNAPAMHEDDKDLNQHEVMARAGDPEESEVDDEMEEHSEDFSGLDRLAHGDVVGRIMHRMYSEGGKIANEGEDEVSHLAGGLPNEFDDLALRDDLDSTQHADGGGDAREDEDRHDIIARIMRQRSMKQRNPVPA